jgi:hypothetical protein
MVKGGAPGRPIFENCDLNIYLNSKNRYLMGSIAGS